jgi:ABC-2 type transport system permease protein
MKTNLFILLISKELKEQWRSGRLLIMLAVFLFFGIVSPLTAKYMPDIISSMVKDQNITIQIPEATWKDAIGQFVKNISQMGVFIIILLSMGTVAKEKENGTASFLLVKPVSRNLFILSKFFSQFISKHSANYMLIKI